MMKVSLRKTRTFTINSTEMKEDTRRLIVWWYGPITKNTRAESVPKVVVFFRTIDDNGKLGAFIRRETALTHLGLLRIGSVWHKGIRNALTNLQVKELDVSFSKDDWKIISPHLAVRKLKQSSPIPSSDYPLCFSLDKNKLLKFSLSSNKKLLIPCTEFYIRCYGRSQEVRRVLATYPWREASRRLFKPVEEGHRPDTWPVKLSSRLYNSDVTFLAHALYDPYTKLAAKSIYSQIEAGFNANDPFTFLKVMPWFHGSAKILVAGKPINEGKTFLGLRILGCSHPQGNTILRYREKCMDSDESSIATPGSEKEKTFPIKKLPRLPNIVNLTEDDEPDHGASSIPIEEDEFEVLGEPRTIIDVRRGEQGGALDISTTDGDETTFSTGEPYGSGKGVGHASISARAVMESQGVLRDMWNAILYLKKCQPGVVKSVEWFTFEDSFSSEPEPKLIALEPFSEEEPDIDNSKMKWVFMDPSLETTRGALTIKINTPDKMIYLFEIQRRLRKIKDKTGKLKDGEEAFQGLIFVLDNQNQLTQWIRSLLSEVRHAKGVVKKLTGLCPGVAQTFNHSPANGEQVPCEAAVRNALSKVGVTI